MTLFTLTSRASRPVGVPSRTPLAPLLGMSLLRLGLLLLGLGAVSCLLAALGTPFAREWRGWSANLIVVAVDLATLGLVARLLAREGSSVRTLLGRFRPRDAAVGLLVGVGLLVALLASTYLANLAVYQGPPPSASVDPGFRLPLWFGLWCLLVMPVTIALAEEVLYRGYLQPRWIGHLGRGPGMLAVASFFGLQHLAFALTTPQAAMARVLAMVLVGVVFALLYRRIGCLWPLVVGHWFVDVLGLGLPVFLASLGG